MRAMITILLAVGLTCEAQTMGGYAGPVELYGVNAADDSLSVLSPVTGEITRVGPLDSAYTPVGGSGGRFTTPVAMAVRPSDGALYVWNNSGNPVGTNPALTIVDRCSGEATVVAASGTPRQRVLQALATAPDGRLFGFGMHYSSTGSFYALHEIDTATGVSTVVGRVDSNPPEASGRGYRVFGADVDASGTLYGIVPKPSPLSPGQQTLITVNTATGAAQVVGPLSQDVGTPGSIAFTADGRLFGTAFGPAMGNVLFEVDPVTAEVSNIRTSSGFPPQGMGFAPARSECPGAPPVKWRTVTGSYIHACALATNGRAYCWGDDYHGQLGFGSSGSVYERDVPTPVAPPYGSSVPLYFATISAGGGHTCGITLDGASYCWGANSSGQLGNYGGSEPQEVLSSIAFASISAGENHTCGLTAAGEAYCWGDNYYGQLGNGTTTDSTDPVPVTPPYSGARFSSVTAGWGYTCGITMMEEAYCWGVNDFGQLGIGASGGPQIAPTRVAGGHRFSSLDAGSWHTCGVTASGDALCWGQNDSGELGHYSTEMCSENTICISTPTAVAGQIQFQVVKAGGGHTCGLTTSGQAFCWGVDSGGTLGTGMTHPFCPTAAFPCSYEPLPVFGGDAYQSLAAGHPASCAIAIDGAQYCWGWGPMLGLGPSVTQSDVPMMTADP